MTLIAADIGNALIKYRAGGIGDWTWMPAAVRPVAGNGFQFTDETPLRPFTYQGGPADLPPTPVLIGADALRGGTHDLAIVGSADQRVRSDAYLWQHLAAIAASLPDDMTSASVTFAGGLPNRDMIDPTIRQHLRSRLRGRHQFAWGERVYDLQIERVALVPQAVAGLATVLIDANGLVQPGALNRRRFALDSGGGTSDYTGRTGLDLIPGSEGGFAIGVMNVAETVVASLGRRGIRHVTAATIMHQIQRNDLTIFHQGETVAFADDLTNAARAVTAQILTVMLRVWGAALASGEVVVFGGGSDLLAPFLTESLRDTAPVVRLAQPITRVVEGIERMERLARARV